MGSVSQIGWEWYSGLAPRVPVTLVTHSRNREALASAGAPLPGSEIHYIDTEWFAGPLYRLANRMFPRSQHAAFLVSSLDYFVYDHESLALLKALHPEEKWDIVHAVTPVSPVAATRLHKLGLPVILGPWNGGLASPPNFPEIMKDDVGWLYWIRDIGRYIDRLFGTSASAAVILTATDSTEATLLPQNRARSVRMLENGVNLEIFQPATWDRLPSARDPLRIIFVGRLVPFKGVAMLIEALRRVRNDFPVELSIVGDGPLRRDLEGIARAAGVEDIVRFLGALSLPDVAAQMRRSHVFCLPSVRESGGAVVLEAMASGLPALAANYGGPAEIVDDEIGRLLSVSGSEALIADMVTAFREITRDPETWRQKGLAGRDRAEQRYSWAAKITAMLEIYQRVLKERSVNG